MAKFGKLSAGKVGEVENRGVIAQWVVIGSAVGLVLLSIVVIWAAKDKQGNELIETTRMVYTSLLPLLGTWVGTVLAYYFSKDNFEAATKSTRENLEIALQQRLEKLQIEPNMRRLSDIKTIQIEGKKSEKDILLPEIQGVLGGKITRVPIMDKDNKAKYVVHQSVLYQFIAEKSVEAANINSTFDVKSATLEELLQHKDLRQLVSETLAFIRLSASLAEAKEKMEGLKNSQDIFVTQSGSADEPVIGWLTNTRIARLAKA